MEVCDKSLTFVRLVLFCRGVKFIVTAQVLNFIGSEQMSNLHRDRSAQSRGPGQFT